MNEMLSLASRTMAALCATALCGLAHGAALQLSCKQLRPAPTDEARTIAHKAKGVVTRAKKQLTIKARARAIVMADDVSDDEMEGTYYYFCDRKDGHILVTVFDGGDASGSLINEATGKVRPAGTEVIFNADRSAYYFPSHSSGSDVGEWTLYGTDAALWSGTAGFLSKNGQQVLATFVQPAFDAQGRLTAQAACYATPEQRWPVTLEKKGGKWAWTPARKCPAP